MKKLSVPGIALLLVGYLFNHASLAREENPFSLPEGALARLGKGEIGFNDRALAYSPDGTRLAVATSIGIWLYNAHTGAEMALITGHTRYVFAVSFSPDGSTLASGSWDNTIRLWDVSSGQEKDTLTGHTRRVTAVSFSPDGSTLASGSWDNTIRLWDVNSGQTKATLAGHTFEVNAVAFSPDGSTLASGSGNPSSWEGTIRLWDVASGQKKATLAGQSFWINSVAFSPDGSTVAGGGGLHYIVDPFNEDPTTIGIWDVASGQEKITLKGHSSWVNAVAFSPDGHILASGSGDGTILLWDMSPYVSPQIPDPDFDGDGTVSFTDFLKFAAQFGLIQSDDRFDVRFDLDGDGTIGFGDFLIFAGAFGKDTSSG